MAILPDTIYTWITHCRVLLSLEYHALKLSGPMEDNGDLLLNDLMNEEYYLMDEEDYQVDFDVSFIKFFRMAGFSMLNPFL